MQHSPPPLHSVVHVRLQLDLVATLRQAAFTIARWRGLLVWPTFPPRSKPRKERCSYVPHHCVCVVSCWSSLSGNGVTRPRPVLLQPLHCELQWAELWLAALQLNTMRCCRALLCTLAGMGVSRCRLDACCLPGMQAVPVGLRCWMLVEGRGSRNIDGASWVSTLLVRWTWIWCVQLAYCYTRHTDVLTGACVLGIPPVNRTV